MKLVNSTNERNLKNLQQIYFKQPVDKKQKEHIYHDYLMPFSKKYPSVLNTVTLLGAGEFDFLNDQDVWMIRDGLIPLSYFFANQNSNDFNSNLKLIIDRKFYFLVPPSWRSKVLFYGIKAKSVYDKDSMPQNMYLAGIANEALIDANEFKELVLKIHNEFGASNFENININAFFPDKRSDLWGKWKDSNLFKFSNFMFENIKLDINFPSIDVIKSKSNFNNTVYIEFNSQILLSDSYLKHMLLSRGAGLMKEEPLSSKFKIIESYELSEHHSVDIYEYFFDQTDEFVDPLESELSVYLKKLLTKGHYHRDFHEGWESWYGVFIKKYYKSLKLI